ncbi:hypothetical protein N657DRAFT_216915 [Parathielavia appendiculata]|uniref:Uncharacterized protein n=1 Tax=Parathielavia appendiculata TaxID=2587402 RepID=A0AAN6U6W6_9PEZI|nr:hypothetical protein N657DRAFT_216915 [Parathielavia appendiculata]
MGDCEAPTSLTLWCSAAHPGRALHLGGKPLLSLLRRSLSCAAHGLPSRGVTGRLVHAIPAAGLQPKTLKSMVTSIRSLREAKDVSQM